MAKQQPTLFCTTANPHCAGQFSDPRRRHRLGGRCNQQVVAPTAMQWPACIYIYIHTRVRVRGVTRGGSSERKRERERGSRLSKVLTGSWYSHIHTRWLREKLSIGGLRSASLWSTYGYSPKRVAATLIPSSVVHATESTTSPSPSLSFSLCPELFLFDE